MGYCFLTNPLDLYPLACVTVSTIKNVVRNKKAKTNNLTG